MGSNARSKPDSRIYEANVSCSVVGSGFTGTMSLVMHVQRSTALGFSNTSKRRTDESLAGVHCINIAAQYSPLLTYPMKKIK